MKFHQSTSYLRGFLQVVQVKICKYEEEVSGQSKKNLRLVFLQKSLSWQNRLLAYLHAKTLLR
jgi:hypothetical protein